MRVLLVVIAGCVLAGPGGALAEEGGAGADAARRAAYELAGAFANDGFRLRDGFVSGEIEPGRPVIVGVSLFRGNAYWFTAATDQPGRRLAVSLHDSEGRPLGCESHTGEQAVAAGIEPETTGTAYVRLELVEGSKGPFALIYSYK